MHHGFRESCPIRRQPAPIVESHFDTTRYTGKCCLCELCVAGSYEAGEAQNEEQHGKDRGFRGGRCRVDRWIGSGRSSVSAHRYALQCIEFRGLPNQLSRCSLPQQRANHQELLSEALSDNRMGHSKSCPQTERAGTISQGFWARYK
jgi:hypothetical protein